MPIRSDQIMQNLWKATGFLTLSNHTQTLNKIPNHTATTEMQPNKLRSIEMGTMKRESKETLFVIEFSLDRHPLIVRVVGGWKTV